MRLRMLLLSVSLVTAGCPGTEAPPDAGGDASVDGGRCTAASDCDDGLFCNGDETCDDGRCTAGVPPNCRDEIACTIDVCNEDRVRCENRPPDEDGDGYGAMDCMGNDCDDDDPLRFPGNLEVCDAAGHDEDCSSSTLGTRDVDGDGRIAEICCNPTATGTTCGTDCNDTFASAYPTAIEVCNEVDDDCDGTIDEDATVPVYLDADLDGYGAGAPVMRCAETAGYSADGNDCDDDEVARSPGQPEFCDSVDNDCDGAVDDDVVDVAWFADVDGDGFGDPADASYSCVPIADRVLRGTDCDDTTAMRSPAVVEICNAIDDDCDGLRDFSVGLGDFEDDDRDGVPDLACGAPRGEDCDDTDPSTGGGVGEICDGRDNDCDETIDEALSTAVYYRDVDGDGYGSAASGAIVACLPLPGHVAFGGDCDDHDAERMPGGEEICDALDQDCDGALDEAPATAFCKLPGTANGVCRAGRCEPSVCFSGRGNCDGDGDNGCEEQLSTSEENCGICGNTCSTRPHASPVCTSGRCGYTCDSGFSDCDGLAANGCEVSGTCDACTTGRLCGSTCTDLDSDEANCGACGHACGVAATCIAGECDRFIEVAVGQLHSCGLREGGGVACWGGTSTGENGSATPGPAPIAVDLRHPAVALVSMSRAVCALLDDGTVECWGQNGELQLGEAGSFPAGTHSTVNLTGAFGLPLRLVAGEDHVVAWVDSNTLVGWGNNTFGQLGGAPGIGFTPTVIGAMRLGSIDESTLVAGRQFTCVTHVVERPSCLGSLGAYFDTSASGIPTTLDGPAFPRGTSIGGVAGAYHFCTLTGSGGGLWCGAVADGLVAIAATATPPALVRSSLGGSITALGGAWSTMCAVSAVGTVTCAGANSRGELGRGTMDAGSSVPGLIPGFRARSISSSAAGNHLCAIDPGGHVWCWGANDVGGAIGVATPLDVLVPTRVPGL